MKKPFFALITFCLSAAFAQAYYIGTDTLYRVVSGGVTVSVRVQNLSQGFGTMHKPGERVSLSWPASSATLLS